MFSPFRAPMDCVQYFTGTSGTFMTYNYRAVGGQQLQSQNYAFCFRQEEGKVQVISARTIGKLEAYSFRSLFILDVAT